ncbi:hypothetical protein KSP40_PGU010713 [Platanthera guangdongensis]|uniref:Uncharacterized protein n=1 Tax=Platanthera guangdongensis TaxID=2320717 RepID=A0ABR2MG88_9ASPA
MKIIICRSDFGCRCNRIGRNTLWQDQSPGQTNAPPPPPPPPPVGPHFSPTESD